MAEATGEKIGVVVVHGVGETREGWINDCLVPDLQRWMAYRNVAAAVPEGRDKDMVLVAPARDGRHLAVALDCDEHFQGFCKAAGLADMAANPGFLTPERRKRHRDLLIEQIEPVVARQTANEWLAVLAAAKVPAAIAFAPQGEVYRVRDPESRDPARTWTSFTRRLPLDKAEVLFTELYWSDLSRVGYTRWSRLTAILELGLEAPFYLARALLEDSRKNVHFVIRTLVLSANWLMRWPIAGLNVAILLTALVAIGLSALPAIFDRQVPEQALPMVLVITLVSIGASGVMLCRKWLHDRPGLADLALSASASSMLLIAFLVRTFVVTEGQLPTSADYYLVRSIEILLLAWTMWTVPTLLAIVLVGLVGAKRLVLRRSASAPPLVRPAAAIALNLLLAIFLKFVFASLGFFIIAALMGGTAIPDQACTARGASVWSGEAALTRPALQCQLALLDNILLDVTVLNATAIIVLVITAFGIATVRATKKAYHRTLAQAGALQLPRLIASPVFIAVLFIGALVNAALVYLPQFADLSIPGLPLTELRSLGLGPKLGGVGLVLAFLLLGWIIRFSNGFIHIGRDLVDHQYGRSRKSLAMRLGSSRHPRAGTEAKTGAAPPAPKRFPRRMRIQRRLEALIENVVARQKVDRLVFLAHSQGTVIVLDYLMDNDQLIEDRQLQMESLKTVKAIDVITLGSPLTHIYKHYFADYERILQRAPLQDAPINLVDSWTNIWRVDDPIGQSVDLAGLRKVANRGIAPGGHTFYWKEHPVCEALWAAITAKPASAAASADARPAVTRSFTIGRDPACDIVAADPTVSRRHATLSVAGTDHYVIVDDASTHGTFVLIDGQWTQVKQAPLRADTPVRLGAYECTAAELLRHKRSE